MKYLLWIDDKDEGPYDQVETAQMLFDGRVTKETLCLPEDGNGDWKPIEEVPASWIPERHPATDTVPRASRAVILESVWKALAYAGTGILCGGAAFLGYEVCQAAPAILYIPLAMVTVVPALGAAGAFIASACTFYELVYDHWRSFSTLAAIPTLLIISVPLLIVGVILFIVFGSLLAGAAALAVGLWPLLVIMLLALLLGKK